MRDRSFPRRLSAKAVGHLRSFRDSIDAALPGRVEQVVLFGSRARGSARRESDYDVAVFVRDLDSRRDAQHAAVIAAHPHLLAGVHIVPIALPHDYLTSADPTPLARNIAREGITIE